MKMAVIGGGGVRVPLLVSGLVHSDLPIADIALFDVDQKRLTLIAPLAARFAGRARLVACRTMDECLEGADFVLISIRVGGIETRARDEAAALERGIVGQETVGPCGFAMAMRTIPEMVTYARAIERQCPQAWVINFTNPVGIVTQAVLAASGTKIIGICDTPTELFEDVAHALDLPSSDCYFDYVGLNHLGWLREVYHRGEPQLERLWTRPDLLQRIYRAPLFEIGALQKLRLLPTEYVYYYYRARHAVENLKRAGTSRGLVLQALNRQLFADLANKAYDPVQTYERYLTARNAGYMQIESGAAAPLERSPWAGLTGYDRIALATVRAIQFDTGDIIPLNVRNRGNLSDLEDDDVIEAPCSVGANGALPLHVGCVPGAVRDLILQVKDYERRTVRAALTGDRAAATDALARNPLVPTAEVAADLVSVLVPA
jgi:6-phospho-beta-glucosidase